MTDHVHPKLTEAFVTALSQAGATIELDRYAGTGHVAVRSKSARSPPGSWPASTTDRRVRLHHPDAVAGWHPMP